MVKKVGEDRKQDGRGESGKGNKKKGDFAASTTMVFYTREEHKTPTSPDLKLGKRVVIYIELAGQALGRSQIVETMGSETMGRIGRFTFTCFALNAAGRPWNMLGCGVTLFMLLGRLRGGQRVEAPILHSCIMQMHAARINAPLLQAGAPALPFGTASILTQRRCAR